MRSALAFLSVVGGSRQPGPRTVDWFAPVGALLGLALGGLWWVTARVWTPGPAAAVVVVADLALTGMLHFDGLVDSGDGLIAPMPRSRRLEVMATPHAGAFGVACGASVLLLRWVALASLRPSILLVGGLWGLSRGAISVVVRSRPYARPGGGLATAFAGPARWPILIAGTAGAVALCAAWRPGPGIAAALCGLVGGAAVVALADRRLGGYTGDVLGATVLLVETVGLLVAAAKW